MECGGEMNGLVQQFLVLRDGGGAGRHVGQPSRAQLVDAEQVDEAVAVDGLGELLVVGFDELDPVRVWPEPPAMRAGQASAIVLLSSGVPCATS